MDGELEWRRCLGALYVAVRDGAAVDRHDDGGGSGGHVTAGIGHGAA